MYKIEMMKKRKDIILKKIEMLEDKRKRSEYSIMNSLINNQPIDRNDTKYFNRYSVMISEYREELHELNLFIQQNEGQQSKKRR